jgi:hypothetical protein
MGGIAVLRTTLGGADGARLPFLRKVKSGETQYEPVDLPGV